jgi:hypothetical protein
MKTAVFPMVLLACLLAGPAAAGDWHINFKLNNDATTQLQNEEQVVVNPNNPNNVVAVWRDFRLGYRECAFATTFDQWRTIARETLFYAHGSNYIWDSDPGLVADANGNFYAVILSYISTSQPNALYVLKSTNGGLTWGPRVTVVDNVSGNFEDKELIACDRTTSPYRGYVYVPWARFGSGVRVMMCRSTNGGASFQAPVAVSAPGSLQWPVPAVGPDGELYIAWDEYSAMNFNKSTDGGATFTGVRTIQNVRFGYGGINGGIGTFSYPVIDVDITNGPRRGWVYCVYEDDEQGSVQDSLDMYFTRSTDGGTTWSAPLRINDDTLGNRRDQFHPWMTVDPQGTIHACWLDRRLDPANMMMDCFYTRSTDGGNTWLRNERVSTVSSDPRLFFKEGERHWKPGMPLAGALPAEHLGEYIGLAAADNLHVYPVWTDTRNGNQDAFGARPDSLSGVWEEVGPSRREPERPGLTAFPNPAKKCCEIRFALSTEAPVRLTIYDISGHAVRFFSSHFSRLTSHSLFWDGRDDSGSEVPSGVYLLRAEDGKESITGRVVVAR